MKPGVSHRDRTGEAVVAAQAQKAGGFFGGVRVDGATQYAAIAGDQAQWPALEAQEAGDDGRAEAGGDFEEGTGIGQCLDHMTHVV